MKFIRSDLPHPNSADEDGYDGGGVKKSATGSSTTAEDEAVKLFLTGDDEVAAVLGFWEARAGERAQAR